MRTEMSFSVTSHNGDFEWAGTSLRGIFAQPRSFMCARRWRLLFDIVRFNQFALDIIDNEDEGAERPTQQAKYKYAQTHSHVSIGEYLDREGYSQTFKDDYLIPMTALVWGTTSDKALLHFPILPLVRFMWNHQLLSIITKRSDWLTIPGGTRQYIDAVMKDFPNDRIHLNSRVEAVVPQPDGRVMLRVNENELFFDHVVLATHGDQAFNLLRKSATKQEQDVLEGFRTTHNIVVLHSDLALMPKRIFTWSAWNFITESHFPPNRNLNISKICLTYWMNLLQHIPEKIFGPVLVTLNPLHPPIPESIHGVWEYCHPVYDSVSLRSQKLLPSIQNERGISYCGAWTKYGFHEDGFSSGIAAAQDHLGAKLPFPIVDSTLSRGQKPGLTLGDHAARCMISAIQLYIILVGFLWQVGLESLNSRLAKLRRP